MLQTVAIGVQRFTEIRENNIFYVDKTGFIKEWWESGDEVTVITRPRRFGKTLNMNMLENFFSIQYAGREDLFTGLEIWQYEEYRKLQGTWPVILISFAKIKPLSYDDAIEALVNINQLPSVVDASEPIPLGNLAFLFAKIWNVKGGIFFRITKGAPRYAYKQLKADGIIDENKDPSSKISGIDALNIYTSCSFEYGKIELGI